MRAALLAVVCATACYAGSAHPTSPAELQRQPGWTLVAGVPEIRQAGEQDCGPAAAAMLLAYWGQTTSPAKVRAGAGVPGDRAVAAGLLRDELRRLGLSAYLIEGTFADLEHELSAGRPVIVGQAKRFSSGIYAHYVVVVGMNRARHEMAVIDPARGWQADSFDGFEKEWAPAGRLTMVVFPPVSHEAAISAPLTSR